MKCKILCVLNKWKVLTISCSIIISTNLCKSKLVKSPLKYPKSNIAVGRWRRARGRKKREANICAFTTKELTQPFYYENRLCCVVLAYKLEYLLHKIQHNFQLYKNWCMPPLTYMNCSFPTNKPRNQINIKTWNICSTCMEVCKKELNFNYHTLLFVHYYVYKYGFILYWITD